MKHDFTETPAVENILVQETGVGRYQVRAEAGDAAFLIDEPVAFGGLGSGPNPYDLLSAALGACTAMTVRLYADRKDWPLDHVAVRVGHQRARSGARDKFDRELMIEGPLDSVQRNRLLEIANRCPVHLTLERGSEIATSLRGPVLDERVTRHHGTHLRDMTQACGEAVAPAA